MSWERAAEFIAVELNYATNELEVTCREPSNQILCSNPPQPAPDRVYKEFYGVVDGKIERVRIIEGTHVPASTTPEQFQF